MVQLLWSSEDESSLWQSDLARERPSVCDPSVGQKDSLLQLKGLTIATGRLKKQYHSNCEGVTETHFVRYII